MVERELKIPITWHWRKDAVFETRNFTIEKQNVKVTDKWEMHDIYFYMELLETLSYVLVESDIWFVRNPNFQKHTKKSRKWNSIMKFEINILYIRLDIIITVHDILVLTFGSRCQIFLMFRATISASKYTNIILTWTHLKMGQ